MEIRNIAIIAHVDHGKTTLTDALMRQTGMVTDDAVSMDSNALEKERGITIYAKNASLIYPSASSHQVGGQAGRAPTKINIVDTPGHADFGSEVERVLRSIDSVLLLVDAQEGPMPQTKFVLKKALELGLKPIVVINKIDKPAARPAEVHDLVLELFFDLGANDAQLDFTTVYAIGKQGIAKKKLTDESKNLDPLLDTILEKVPPALADTAAPFRMQPFNLGYDNYVGRLAVGRVYEGVVRVGDNVFVRKPTGETRAGAITKLFTFTGMQREEASEAVAGDIVMIAGIPDIDIGETICAVAEAVPLPAITVDEPTIALNFLVNNSPFAGREGKLITSRQLRERLERELEVNVGLKIRFESPDVWTVHGRGELHIAILLETMRREGYEMQVSQPQVILKKDNSQIMEPFEEVTIDVPTEIAGVVIEKLAKRRGLMTEMRPTHGHTRLIFEIPTRGLLGYRGEFIVDTRGEGIMASRVVGFRPHVGEIERKDTGSMISMETGKAAGYALWNLQERGMLYIGPGVELYEGMVIGNTAKGLDMTVNPIKGKQLTNMRASGSDEAIQLTPAWEITLERGLEVMSEDEYLEITPQSIRLRKKWLKETDRNRAGRKGKE